MSEVPAGWNAERHAEVTERVRAWDADESVWTLDMSGMGPGYEQAIQILAIETCRDALEGPLPSSESTDEEKAAWGEAAVTRSDEAAGGYSGAQVGAARWLAYRICAAGWDELKARALAENDPGRVIQASRFFPSAV